MSMNINDNKNIEVKALPVQRSLDESKILLSKLTDQTDADNWLPDRLVKPIDAHVLEQLARG